MTEAGNPRPGLDPHSSGAGGPGPSVFRVGRWRVEVSRNRICDAEGEERRLEPQLASLLSYFAARPGVVVSKDELLEGVWGTRHVADSALTRAIAELRRSLGDEAHNPSYIETIPKRGYRLLAEVQADADGAPAGRGWTRRVLAAALVGAMLLAGILATDWLRSAPPQEARASSRRIAVLPLVELSATEGQEYFADAMTDALTTVLARVPSLSVTSRRSVERYRDSAASSQEIARGLGVDLLLEGTILRDANRVRFTVQLIDPGAEENVWAGSYERELRDVVSLQGEIAVAIAREVQGSLSADTRRELAGRSVDPRAHDLYLRGRHRLWTGPRSDSDETRELFERALEIDPTYAPAWAGLAEYYAMRADYGPSPGEGYRKAEEAALQALALDPQLAEAHASLGTVAFLHDWDWDRAGRHFLRALELNPSDAGVRRQYAFFLTCQGRFEEAIAHSREAVRLDPLTEDQRTGLGWIYLNAGRYEESLRALREQPARMPRSSSAHPLYTAWNHGLAGRFDEAIGILDEHRNESPGWKLWRASLGWTLARAGRRAEAEAILQTLVEEISREGGDPYLVAIVAAGLEDVPTTMQWLERSFTERSPNMIHVKIEPFFGPIRDAEPYREMIRRMNL